MNKAFDGRGYYKKEEHALRKTFGQAWGEVFGIRSVAVLSRANLTDTFADQW